MPNFDRLERSADMTTTPDARAGAVPAPQPFAGNALESMAGFLTTLGLTRPDTRVTIEDAIAAELSSRGFEADVHSVRYGIATLLTDPQTATLLRYDVQDILEAVNAQLEQPLTSLTVRTRAVAA